MSVKARVQFLMILLSALFAGAGIICPAACMAETVNAGDLEFTMPPGWVPKTESAPGARAAYDLYYQGRPYAEMYLGVETIAEPRTASQMLEEGIRKNAPNLLSYRPAGTSSVRLAGTDGVLHDFTYYYPQSTVPFTGRVVVIVLNNTVYTFFFNTVSNYFPYVTNAYSAVISSIRAVEKPAPVPAFGIPSTTGQQQAVEKRTVEEQRFLIDLAPGWKEAPPGGVKYRFYNQRGDYVAGFSVMEPKDSYQTIAVFCLPTGEDPLKAVMNRKFAEMKGDETYGDLREIGRESRNVAGCSALTADYSFKMHGRPAMTSFCLVAVKDKQDTETVLYPPTIYEFWFWVTPEKYEEAKAVIKVLLDSVRFK